MSKLLPKLMVWLTKQPRYIPEVEWSDKSWIHNTFRVYELIFGRRYGIKAEMITTYHNGVVIHQARSFEAMCALAETYIRELLKFRIHIPIKIWIPKLSNPIGLPSSSPFMFAIALDTSNQNLSAGPGNTFSFTCTGSNRLLFVSNVQGNGGDHVSSILYGLASMTQDANSPADGTAAACDFWMLVAPATGANNIVNTGNTASDWCAAISYTGASQTGQPDSSAKSTNTTSVATTVVASNCWLVGVSANEADAGLAAPPASNRTDRENIRDIRNNGLNQFGGVMYDSNGVVATGAQSTTLTGTGARWANIVASFAPGATTSIFSVAGVPQASISSVAGVTNANIKSVAGVPNV